MIFGRKPAFLLSWWQKKGRTYFYLLKRGRVYFWILKESIFFFFSYWILWRVHFSNIEFCKMSENWLSFPPRQTPDVVQELKAFKRWSAQNSMGFSVLQLHNKSLAEVSSQKISKEWRDCPLSSLYLSWLSPHDQLLSKLIR